MPAISEANTFSEVREDQKLISDNGENNEQTEIIALQSDVSEHGISEGNSVQESFSEEEATDTKGNPDKGYWHWSRATEEYKVEALKLACKVSHCDLNFIRKITGENGALAHDKQSTIPRSGHGSLNGYEDSWGYCQMYRPFQAKYLEDPRFWNDKEWQMTICYEKYKNGTPMYANYRPKSEFTWVEY